jgi:hypothetical protein
VIASSGAVRQITSDYLETLGGQMILVIAGNHSEFEEYIRKNFRYIGDRDALAGVDPKQVEKVIFTGNYRNHPFYWSDDLIRFQMEVALNERDINLDIVKDKPNRRRLLKFWSNDGS